MNVGDADDIVIMDIVVIAAAFYHEVYMTVTIKSVICDNIVGGCLVKAYSFQIICNGIVYQLIVIAVEEPQKSCWSI